MFGRRGGSSPWFAPSSNRSRARKKVRRKERKKERKKEMEEIEGGDGGRKCETEREGYI